jgi:hypothetical protein
MTQAGMIYHKGVSIPLLFSGIFAFTITALLIYTALIERYDYSVFFFVILAPVFFLAFIDIKVYPRSVAITKYAVLGMIRRKVELTTNNILAMTGYEDKLEVDQSYLYEPGDDSFWTLLGPGSVKTNITEFNYLDAEKVERTLTLKLRELEYRFIWKALNNKCP